MQVLVWYWWNEHVFAPEGKEEEKGKGRKGEKEKEKETSTFTQYITAVEWSSRGVRLQYRSCCRLHYWLQSRSRRLKLSLTDAVQV